MVRNSVLSAVFVFLYLFCNAQAFKDVAFYSDAFQTKRWYRIYLPKNYVQDTDKRYPVIYYFHGYGGRYKWDEYSVEDDAFYPENGRQSPPYIMEWSDYVHQHDVIIVTWDGYEPNNHAGKNFRDSLTYGRARPYDYDVAHETKSHHWGWDYRKYFRDLVKDVDSHFRTIPDRQYRAITGLSMGGQTAYYIAGQSKDLVSSVSAFDPADNIAMMGPKGRQVALPVLEMFRSLKGLNIRLTMTDGDWLKYNDWKMNRKFQTAFAEKFSFHMADYPNHWAADIPEQLDFHMKHFELAAPTPLEWNHISPFPSFTVFDYEVAVESSQPPIVLMEKLASEVLKIRSKTFIPDGPIIIDDKVAITSPEDYNAQDIIEVIDYNISSEKISTKRQVVSGKGRLRLDLDGGGHILGLNNRGADKKAKLQLVNNHDQTYFYFEEGVQNNFDLKLLNLGLKTAKDVVIQASSKDENIEFTKKEVSVKTLKSKGIVDLNNVFEFSLRSYVDTTYMSSIDFTILMKGEEIGQHKIFFHPTPRSPYVSESDVLILDGRTVEEVPIYIQGPNEIRYKTITGGRGNGNGVLEAGEEALIYIKLPQGMGPNDVNTYHRSQLLNVRDYPYLGIKSLDYAEKLSQAGATSVATVISLGKNISKDQVVDLWFKVESLYNDKADPTSNATIYAQKDDYRKVKLSVEK